MPVGCPNTVPTGQRYIYDYVDLQRGAFIHWNMSTFVDAQTADPNLDVDTFAPTDLDIDQWLDAMVDAGMAYAILTTKHHDGFALWPTAFYVDGYSPYSIAQTEWYANNGSPDVVSLFVTKCRARSLQPVLYFSIQDTTWETRTGTDETTNAAGYIAMIEAQLAELLTDYGNIAALWLDGWGWHMGYEEIPYATIYNYIKGLQPACLVIENYLASPVQSSNSQIYIYEVPAGSGVVPATNALPCEEVHTVYLTAATWFWNESIDQSAANLMAAADVNSGIAQANARNANYVLNFAPGQDGHLPAAQVTLAGQVS